MATGIDFDLCFAQSQKAPTRQNEPAEETSAEDAAEAVAESSSLAVAASQIPSQPSPTLVPTPAPQPSNWPNSSQVLNGVQNDPLWIMPRVTVRRDFGNGVGYQSGYTYIEGFVPTWQSPGDSLVYMNIRGVNYDASQLWEGQLGMGFRQLSDSGIVFGANAFYDGRNTDLRYYNQAGLGWEALGSVWEARGNVYLPVGAQHYGSQTVGAATNPQFVNQNIQIDRLVNNRLQSAMNGCDVEVGRQLPNRWEDVRTSAYMGYYH